MDNYPDTVAKIANDYLSRVGAQLKPVPTPERTEFLREIESHIYEAYQQTPGTDDVSRILVVLRKLGEPADVVADRLPESMLRSGTKRSLPLHILIGIMIALLGVPLGLGGVSVLAGVLAAVAGLAIAYLAVTGSMFLASAVLIGCGIVRAYMPGLWDRLVTEGYIRFDGLFGAFLAHQSHSNQVLVLFLFAVPFAAAGWWMLRAGKHLLRGLRFLANLFFDWVRRAAGETRRVLRRERQQAVRPVTAPYSAHNGPAV